MIATDENDRLVAGTLVHEPFGDALPFKVDPVPARSGPPSPADRVRALARLGPVVRLATGLRTLDAACRGGLPTRRLVVVGGAPGAGKTTFTTDLAWSWAKQGIPVAILAVDEDAIGVLMRIAQLEGIDAAQIEERDQRTLSELAVAVARTALILTDADDIDGTVEGTVALLASTARAGPAVLIVDSIQTVRAAGTHEAKDPRARVDCVVRALKSARDRHGFLILATCELARGAYRSRNAVDQINDLAAFKESGGIEYAAQTALVLRSVPDESSLIDVAMPKNRAYRKDPFRLRLDHRTTAIDEIPLPDAPEERGRRKRDSVEADAMVLRKVLVANPGVHGVGAIRAQLRARNAGMSHDRSDAAHEYLRGRGEIENRGTVNRPALHLRAPPTGGGTDD